MYIDLLKILVLTEIAPLFSGLLADWWSYPCFLNIKYFSTLLLKVFCLSPTQQCDYNVLLCEWVCLCLYMYVHVFWPWYVECIKLGTFLSIILQITLFFPWFIWLLLILQSFFLSVFHLECFYCYVFKFMALFFSTV